MIRLIEGNKVDKERLNMLMDEAPNGNIYSYSWYLDALCDSWNLLVRGDYEQVMVLPVAKKMGTQFVYQPFFSRQIGVFGKEHPSEAEIREFLAAIPSSIKFIQVGFDEWPDAVFEGFEVEQVVHQQVDFDLDLEGIRKRYSTNTKRNIKKAVKANLTIKQLNDPNKIVEIFRANKGGQLGFFSDADFERLAALMQACLDIDRGWALGVFDEQGELHAGAFFMKGQNTLTYLNGAADDFARKNGAMHFAIDHMIEQWHGRISGLDFGGSKVPSVAKFYHTFGSSDRSYVFITKDRLPALVKLARKLKSQF